MDSNDEIKFEKERQSAMIDRYEKMSTIVQMIRADYEVSKYRPMPPEAKIKVIEQWEKEGLISAPKVIEKIVHVEIPKKSTPEELEYARRYREWKKKQQEISDEEAREQLRIQKMLQRKSIMCYSCRKQVECINPTYKLEKRTNRLQEHIVIESVCPICGTKTRAFGGISKVTNRSKKVNFGFSG